MPSEEYKAFSQITVDDVADYIRLNEVTVKERTLLTTMLASARSHVLAYTGQTEEKADTFPEFTIAVYAICEDMYDKRTFQADAGSVNEIVASILGSRSINLL